MTRRSSARPAARRPQRPTSARWLFSPIPVIVHGSGPNLRPNCLQRISSCLPADNAPLVLPSCSRVRSFTTAIVGYLEYHSRALTFTATYLSVTESSTQKTVGPRARQCSIHPDTGCAERQRVRAHVRRAQCLKRGLNLTRLASLRVFIIP